MKIKDIVKKIDETMGLATQDSYGQNVPSNAVRIVKWDVTVPDIKTVEEIWEGGKRAFITPKGNPTANLRRLVFGHTGTINSNALYAFEIEPIYLSEGYV